MLNAWVAPLCLILISLSLLTIAMTVVVTAAEARRTLRRVQHFLPECEAALQEAKAALASSRRLMGRAHRMAGALEVVVSVATGAVGGVMERVASLRDRAEHWFNEHVGNGTRGGPRRRVRGS